MRHLIATRSFPRACPTIDLGADPFQAVELPEIIEEYLHHGTATSIALNRRGTLLAGQAAILHDTAWCSRHCSAHW